MVLVSNLTVSVSPPPPQLAGVAFLGAGLWAWSEKVGVTITGTLSIRQPEPGWFSFNCPSSLLSHKHFLCEVMICSH